MFLRRRMMRVLTVLFLFVCVAPALGAPPTLPAAFSQIKRPFTAEEQQRLQEYVSYWVDQLGSETASAEKITEAAQNLMNPTLNSTASANFFGAYSQAALPLLNEIIQTGKEYQSVQAAKVIGFLGTPEALEKLVRYTDINNEPREAVRLWATRGCQILIERTQENSIINDRQMSSVLRDLKQAAENEEHWLVLHRQFEAMAASNNDAAEQRQLEAFSSVLRRLERNTDAAPLMEAISRITYNFRQQYLRQTVQKQEQFGKALAPMLGRVHAVALAHWEAAQQDASLKKSYAQSVQLSEGLLKFIDPIVRSGPELLRTDLHTAWINGSREQFASETEQWQSILSGPPYK